MNNFMRDFISEYQRVYGEGGNAMYSWQVEEFAQHEKSIKGLLNKFFMRLARKPHPDLVVQKKSFSNQESTTNLLKKYKNILEKWRLMNVQHEINIKNERKTNILIKKPNSRWVALEACSSNAAKRVSVTTCKVAYG